MSTRASQITSVSTDCSIVCSVAYQRKHQSSASLACVKEIKRWPVNSPLRGPVTRKMFPFDGVILSLIQCVRNIFYWYFIEPRKSAFGFNSLPWYELGLMQIFKSLCNIDSHHPLIHKTQSLNPLRPCWDYRYIILGWDRFVQKYLIICWWRFMSKGIYSHNRSIYRSHMWWYFVLIKMFWNRENI